MPEDISSLLGKGKDEEKEMTPEEETKLQQGMGLPNSTDDGEGNPLEKMDKISKTKSDDNKEKSDKKKLDEDTIAEILMTGDNTEGMFAPDEKKEDENGIKLHEEADDDVKKNLDVDAEASKKYIKDFQKDLLKNPEKYTINTPKGKMTITEAMRKGYNPFTKRFDEANDMDKIKEKHLSRLNDEERSHLENLMNPENVGLAPADAEKFGLSPSNPMIRKPQDATAQTGTSPMATNVMPQEAVPTQGQAPVPSMPTAPAQGGVPTQGQPDLSSLLGGGM